MASLESSVQDLADALDALEARLDALAEDGEARERLRVEARTARGRATEARQDIAAAAAALRAALAGAAPESASSETPPKEAASGSGHDSR